MEHLNKHLLHTSLLLLLLLILPLPFALLPLALLSILPFALFAALGFLQQFLLLLVCLLLEGLSLAL